MLTSLYVEGNTFLHRAGVKPKLAVLLIWSLGLYLVDLPWVLAAAAALTTTLYLSLGMPPHEALYRLRPVLFTIAFFAVINAYILSPGEALTMLLRLLAIVFFAAAVTAATRIDEFMDAITSLLRPFERFGLFKAADVALAIGLVLRFVPDIFAHYEALKDAHTARGIPVRTLKMIGPLIVLTLKDADQIADAIDARGIRGQ